MIDTEKLIQEIDALKKDFSFSNAILSEVIYLIRKHSEPVQGEAELFEILQKHVIEPKATRAKNLLEAIRPFLANTQRDELEKVRDALIATLPSTLHYGQSEASIKAKEALTIINTMLSGAKANDQ